MINVVMIGVRNKTIFGSIFMQKNQQKTLIIGAAASGKSQYAEDILNNNVGKKLYLASANIYDEEMQEKVNKHKDRRGSEWTTIAEPLDAVHYIENLNSKEIMLFDCATMWLTNHFLEKSNIYHEIDLLVNSIKSSKGSIITVTNEVGSGIVPDNSMAREFRELQGKLNQKLATVASLVVTVIAGIPLILKHPQ
jgi:adenosylcobinamide kinase/adenosylcobinamide-phosphate guanylyltransferase